MLHEGAVYPPVRKVQARERLLLTFAAGRYNILEYFSYVKGQKMKVGRVIAVAALLLAMAGWQGLRAAGDKPAGEKASPTTPSDGEVKLTYEASAQMAGLLTPRKLVDKLGFQFMNGKGTLDICGKKVAVEGVIVGRKVGFGMDTEGAGAVDPNKMQAVTGKPMLFRLKREGKKEFAVIIDHLTVTQFPNAGVRVSGDFYAACGLRGMINKVPIRIIDDNLDGKITNDGGDAIAIGNSVCAQPLYKIHQIGGSFYEIKVADDMSSLTATKVEDVKPVKLTSKLLKIHQLQALVLIDESNGQAFDAVACKSGIPAGEYSLAYGALGAGKDVVIIKPGKNMKKLTVSEDGGDLGLGPKLKLLFGGFTQGGYVHVNPTIEVVGGAGEIYQPDFGSTSGRPVVTLSEGTKVISQKPMEFG